MQPPSGLISGGGIAGLACALGLSHAGWAVQMWEQADHLSEVGAGLQLGPNATCLLHSWGLTNALRQVASFPEQLQVRCALSGQVLAALPLGAAMLARYGAPYATLHRADLQGLLLQAVQQTPTQIHLGRTLASFKQSTEAVIVQDDQGKQVECNTLVGADGLWSTVRQQLLGDGPAQATGQVAYRALLKQSQLPAPLRSQNIAVWLAPHLHVVQYPVRGGEFLNIVVCVEGQVQDMRDSWDHSAPRQALLAATATSAAPLQDVLKAVSDWRLWMIHDRPPLQCAQQQAVGRVALLGDAAHPMRPYLAQGAGMALEDAAELGRLLSQAKDRFLDVPTLLQRFALRRWQRNASVQARAVRNGQIFHATGALRWARNMSLRLFGKKLLDMPWLYG